MADAKQADGALVSIEDSLRPGIFILNSSFSKRVKDEKPAAGMIPLYFPSSTEKQQARVYRYFFEEAVRRDKRIEMTYEGGMDRDRYFSIVRKILPYNICRAYTFQAAPLLHSVKGSVFEFCSMTGSVSDEDVREELKKGNIPGARDLASGTVTATYFDVNGDFILLGTSWKKREEVLVHKICCGKYEMIENEHDRRVSEANAKKHNKDRSFSLETICLNDQKRHIIHKQFPVLDTVDETVSQILDLYLGVGRDS